MPDPSQQMPPGSAVPLPTTLTPESIRDYIDARMREHREWERQQYGYQSGYSPHYQGNPQSGTQQGYYTKALTDLGYGQHMPEQWQFDVLYRLLLRIVQHLEREEEDGHYSRHYKAMDDGNPYPRHYSREEQSRGYDKQGRPLQLSFRRK